MVRILFALVVTALMIRPSLSYGENPEAPSNIENAAQEIMSGLSADEAKELADIEKQEMEASEGKSGNDSGQKNADIPPENSNAPAPVQPSDETQDKQLKDP